MKIEIARHERMSQSGSSLLRLIQNTNTSRLDLLVRESLQNSLDAGNKKSNSVEVSININKFDTSQIAKFFEKIEDKLLDMHGGEQSCIVIKDMNTTGLTGPRHYSEMKNDNNFGNLLKLVYEISKPQEKDGSGGSWGLGKTVYFRIGIGLVLYYSRIQIGNNEYESRLAAALVEDENSPLSLIPKISGSVQRGIAWWGSRFNDTENTIPVTDQDEINSIISCFGIDPYKDDETGTTIIIPFIDEESLLKEANTVDNVIEPYWLKPNRDGRYSIIEYLKIAVQRWYAPRIDNIEYMKFYQQQFLSVSINNEKITNTRMAPIFKVIQSLYNASIESKVSLIGESINTEKISLRNIFKNDGLAGRVSFVKVSAKDMLMEAPDNLFSPYYYINQKNIGDVENSPIITYTRKPGMIISYELNGDWTDGIPKTSTGEFIVGVFVPAKDKKLKAKSMTLEEYLRKSEKADHMSWVDITDTDFKPFIVSKIQGHVRDKLKKSYTDTSRTNGDRKNLGLGRALADALLPPLDFSNWDDARGGNRGDGGAGGNESGKPSVLSEKNRNKVVHKKPVLKIINGPVFGNNSVRIDVEVIMGKCDNINLELFVNTENGFINSVKWESQLEEKFPMEIKSFKLSGIKVGKGKEQRDFIQNINLNDDGIVLSVQNSKVHINYLKSEEYGVNKAISVEVTNNNNIILLGELEYSVNKVRGVIQLSKNQGE